MGLVLLWGEGSSITFKPRTDPLHDPLIRPIVDFRYLVQTVVHGAVLEAFKQPLSYLPERGACMCGLFNPKQLLAVLERFRQDNARNSLL